MTVFKGESVIGFDREMHPRSAATSWRTIPRIGAILLGLFLLAAFFTPTLLSAQSLQPGGPVNFGAVALGKTSNTTILSFYASSTTTISSVVVTTDGASSQDFVLVSQNCVGTLLQFETCNITLAFSPLQVGLRIGALSIIEGDGSVGNRTYLHGVGLGPQLLLGPVSATAMATVAPLSPSSFTPTTAVYDGAGDLYFNDIANGRILEQTFSGTLSTVANLVGGAQSAMTISGDGTLYISSASTHSINAIAPDGTVSTFSTSPLTVSNPAGVVADSFGFLYIADSQANQIIRVALDGSGAIVVPITGIAPLSGPTGLALDNNNLYIADSGNNRILAVSFSTGAATVLNPSGGLSNPTGIAVDASGTLIVANTGAGNILQITPSGTVFSFPIAAGVITATTPSGIVIKPNGDLLSADTTLGLVTITRNNPSITFATPTKIDTFDSTDGYATLTLQNSGNQPVQLTGTPDPSFSGPAFSIGNTSTCASLPSGSGTPPPLAPATVCTYAIGFTPTIIGTNSAVLSVNGTATGTNALVSATAQLSGTGLTNITTLQVTASPTVTSQGVPVSFTVTALIGTTVATDFLGTVTFTTTDSTGVFLSGASYTFTAADAGTHTFLAPAGAQFNQVGVFTISAHIGSLTGISNAVTVTNLAQIALTSSVNPSLINQQTTLTATLRPPVGSNAPTPTGTVAFMNGTATLGTATLVSGQATFPASFSTAGTYSPTVVYQGDTNYVTVTSAPVSQVVNDYKAKVSLTSSANPTPFNTQITLTATVTAATGQGTPPAPTGTVAFFQGTTQLGTAPLINGQASLPATFSTPGSYTLTAVYSGDPSYNIGTSPNYTQIVTGYTSQVSLTSSANPTLINNPITLTAAVVAAPGQGTPPTPTGTITFLQGTTSLGTATIIAGQATLAVNFAAIGTYPITAVYSGDTYFLTATSLITNQVIEDFSIVVATGTSGTSTVLGGSSTSYTFTVSPVGGVTLIAPINLGLSGFPAGTIATFSPATLPTGGGPATVTLTVKPPAAQAHLDRETPLRRTATHDAPIILAFLLLPFAFRRRGRRPAAAFLWLLLCASAIGLTGCITDASSGYYANNPGTYTLTVTASSGALSHAATVTLIVQ
jgi:sugar lactone lactonase YvrE